MKKKVKHFILLGFSIALLVSTLFVPMPAKSVSEMASIKFGYPLQFVSQDFSRYNTFSFFPRYQRFEFNNLSEVVDFSVFSCLVSLLVIFIFVEGVVYVLEYVKFFVLEKVLSKKVE